MRAFLTTLVLVFCCQPTLQDDHATDEKSDETKDRDWNFHAPSMNFFNSAKGDINMETYDDLKMRIESLENAASAKAERIQANCMAMQNLLSVMQPEITSDSAPAAPMPNPVSGAIGSDEGNEYLILFPITSADSSVSPAPTLTDQPSSSSNIPEGLNIDGAFAQTLGNTLDTAAMSITDFNFFRIQMVRAIRVLDQSIRDILDSSDSFSCSDVGTTTMTPGETTQDETT